jgi:hypothetical protein
MCIGPIVRIRPDSIHINDPSLTNQVQGTATDRRDTKLDCNVMMSPKAFISTSESDLHRKRRAPLLLETEHPPRRATSSTYSGKVLNRLGKHANREFPLERTFSSPLQLAMS